VIWKESSVAVPFEAPKPLPGHLAPLDRRHRWLYQKRAVVRGRDVFRYRCVACRKWASVEPIVNLIARKHREAEHSMKEYLSETLWAK
jgi:hypothetical protein